MSFVGHWAVKAIEGVQADIAFVGCDGFHSDGPCSRSYRELEVKQKILENSQRVVLVTDSSKFSINGLYRFATFNQINNLITDTNVKRDQCELIPSNIHLDII